MTDERIDELLHETLTAVHPDDVFNQKIRNKIMAENAGKENKMRRTGVKKTFIIAAACCLLFSTVVIASTGIIKYSVAHSTSGEYTDYEDIAKAEDRAGIKIKAPENFSNGYTFKEAGVVESEDRGENDEVINKFKEIMVAYTKEGEDKVAVYTMPEQHFMITSPDTADNSTTIDGIEVYYYTDTYKWVRPDYELTDEDKRRQEEEGLQISVGVSENYETQTCNCMWIQDGVGYDLLCTDSAIPADTMFEMAREIIQN